MKKLKNLIIKYLSNSAFLDMISNFIFTDFKNKNPTYHVLITAPGGGNIGDQAMLESYIKNTEGKKLIISTTYNKIILPERYIEDTEIVELPNLVYGWLIPYISDLLIFKKKIKFAKSLSIVGADIMDGGYNNRASVGRLNIAKLVKSKGISTKVLGFSWNSQPTPQALNAIKECGEVGVNLFARDPISYNRLIKSAVKNVVQVTDLVFSNTNTEESGIEDILAFATGKKVAIVNASGLVNKGLNQNKEYLEIIKNLRSHNYFILILPHVIREGANHLDICRSIYKPSTDCLLVERLLQPDQIKRIVREARLVITGRMHLSIMSLNNLIPSIVISTQGKVDGLMQLFETPECSIEPKAGFGSQISDLVGKIDTNYSHYQYQLEKNIDHVRSASLNNFF